MNDALTVRNASYQYGKKSVLKEVSFSVPPSRVTALLGPNGAGKTTLFSLICRLLKSRQNEIIIDGMDMHEHPRSALAKIGIVFQQPTLDLDLTVKQNLHYFAALRGMPKRQADMRIEEEMARLRIEDIVSTTVRKLNGGHRRRVEIARALLHEPSLLLLDEPTVGLDVQTRQGFVDYAHHLARDRGVGILWATHLIDEISESEDHIVVLHQGEVLALGSAGQVMRDTRSANLKDAYQVLTRASADES